MAVYRAATRVLSPIAPWLLTHRAARGKEDPARLDERLGLPTRSRPGGALVWLHGASVGESLMLLPLIAAIRKERPELAVLVTTGTVTSAAMMAKRLPKGAVHQYAPVDRPDAVRRFLEFWRPSTAVFAESELWPNLILEAEARGVALALVNARMTAKSLARWTRTPASARRLLDAFAWIAAADARTADGLSRLAGRPAPAVGNLKFAAETPAVDAHELRRLQAAFGERPVWLAASTHPGEDEIALKAHAQLRAASGVEWALILAPRHPERGPDVARLARAEGFTTARRAADEPVTDAQVYVADTLGEMGLWFHLAVAAVMGGSLVRGVGGHNPLEPALARCAFMAGPHTHNFAGLYDEFIDAGGAARIATALEIAQEIEALGPELLSQRVGAAHAVAARGASVLESVMSGLRPLLPTPETSDHARA